MDILYRENGRNHHSVRYRFRPEIEFTFAVDQSLLTYRGDNIRKSMENEVLLAFRQYFYGAIEKKLLDMGSYYHDPQKFRFGLEMRNRFLVLLRDICSTWKFIPDKREKWPEIRPCSCRRRKRAVRLRRMVCR